MVHRYSALVSLLLAFVILGTLAPGPAMAERRVALVVGNNSYRSLSNEQQLLNAVSDARAVKDALEKLGFDVTIGENLDRTAFIDRLSEFGAALHEGDIAFFFYAGHGVALNGANYMLPSDIPPVHVAGRDEEDRLAELAVPETSVHNRIRRAGARVAVVVLDACRNNPLAATGGRSIGTARGLAAPPETRGILSIYSAGIGQEALDGLGSDDRNPNSVFTRVFVQKLAMPGLGLRQLAFDTQAEVARLAQEARADQTPGVYSQIIGEDVYLAGRPAQKADAPKELGDPDAGARADFDLAQKLGTLAAWDAFLAHHPTGFLADVAKSERAKLAALAPPSQEDKPQADKSPEDKKQPIATQRAWLGVQVQKVVEAIAKDLGVPDTNGALVAQVHENGPAQKAGVKVGDVIIKLDGGIIKEPQELAKRIALLQPGASVQISVLRQGKESTLTAILGRIEGEKKAESGKSEPQERAASEPASLRALGMEFGRLDDATRRKFSIKERVKAGAVITAVEAGSAAADKRIQPGDVLVELRQNPIRTLADISKELENVRSSGKHTALLLVANSRGQTRFIAMPVP